MAARGLVIAWLLAGCGAAAAASVEVCFNYGCAASANVTFAEERLAVVAALFSGIRSAPAEREAISVAVAALHRLAGEQSPIAADRAGNFLDDGVDGRMDCIDHATTTTRLLALIESRGWLRHHRVVEPARRTRVIFQHFSAVIEEIEVRRPANVDEAALARAAVPDVERRVPDHVPLLLALCDCQNVVGDIAEPAAAAPQTPQPQASPPDASPRGTPGARFVVDSWFGNHGEPAVILPLAQWLDGEGPNVQ